jgi:hypothetical protein
MSQLKYWDGSQWVAALVGTQGTTGTQGLNGTQGIITDSVAPTNTNVLWMDTVSSPVAAIGTVSPTFTGTVTMPAGTTSTVPIDFISGPLTTTPTTGSFEYDGVNFYSTPTTPAAGYGRSLIPATSVYSLSANRTLTNATGAQNIFGVGFVAAASTTYYFDMLVSQTTGTTSHTLAMSWTTTGTIASILYYATLVNTVAGTAETSGDGITSASAGSTIISASGTSGGRTIKVTGIIRTGTQGTITPNLAFSAAPGGTSTNNINSYWMMTPLGSNTFTNTGGFA